MRPALLGCIFMEGLKHILHFWICDRPCLDAFSWKVSSTSCIFGYATGLAWMHFHGRSQAHLAFLDMRPALLGCIFMEGLKHISHFWICDRPCLDAFSWKVSSTSRIFGYATGLAWMHF